MKNIVLSMIALAGLTAACGGSYPQPTERLASTEAAIRSAKELGAQNDPQAGLHVKLAEEQMQSAKALIREDENKRADLVLQRASSDAELAVMITKERAAKSEAQKAHDNLNANRQAPMNAQPVPAQTQTPSTK
ncbi:MAG: DUF4398 domain-containing protein [Labilithrix sp.]